MSEKERNKRFILLLMKLIDEKNFQYVELLETMVLNDHPSMKKSFDIMTESINFKKQ